MSEIEKVLLIEDETESILKIQEILWKKTNLFNDFENLNRASKQQPFITVTRLHSSVCFFKYLPKNDYFFTPIFDNPRRF